MSFQNVLLSCFEPCLSHWLSLCTTRVLDTLSYWTLWWALLVLNSDILNTNLITATSVVDESIMKQSLVAALFNIKPLSALLFSNTGLLT